MSPLSRKYLIKGRLDQTETHTRHSNHMKRVSFYDDNPEKHSCQTITKGGPGIKKKYTKQFKQTQKKTVVFQRGATVRSEWGKYGLNVECGFLFDPDDL